MARKSLNLGALLSEVLANANANFSELYSAVSTIEESLGEDIQKAVVYNTAEDMINKLNAGTDQNGKALSLVVGDEIYILDENTPDFWVCAVNEQSTTGSGTTIIAGKDDSGNDILEYEWETGNDIHGNPITYTFGHYCIRVSKSREINLEDYQTISNIVKNELTSNSYYDGSGNSTLSDDDKAKYPSVYSMVTYVRAIKSAIDATLDDKATYSGGGVNNDGKIIVSTVSAGTITDSSYTISSNTSWVENADNIIPTAKAVLGSLNTKATYSGDGVSNKSGRIMVTTNNAKEVTDSDYSITEIAPTADSGYTTVPTSKAVHDAIAAIPEANSTTAGLMSAADKEALDAIPDTYATKESVEQAIEGVHTHDNLEALNLLSAKDNKLYYNDTEVGKVQGISVNNEMVELDSDGIANIAINIDDLAAEFVEVTTVSKTINGTPYDAVIAVVETDVTCEIYNSSGSAILAQVLRPGDGYLYFNVGTAGTYTLRKVQGNTVGGSDSDITGNTYIVSMPTSAAKRQVTFPEISLSSLSSSASTLTENLYALALDEFDYSGGVKINGIEINSDSDTVIYTETLASLDANYPFTAFTSLSHTARIATYEASPHIYLTTTIKHSNNASSKLASYGSATYDVTISGAYAEVEMTILSKLS